MRLALGVSEYTMFMTGRNDAEQKDIQQHDGPDNNAKQGGRSRTDTVRSHLQMTKKMALPYLVIEHVLSNFIP